MCGANGEIDEERKRVKRTGHRATGRHETKGGGDGLVSATTRTTAVGSYSTKSGTKTWPTSEGVTRCWQEAAQSFLTRLGSASVRKKWSSPASCCISTPTHYLQKKKKPTRLRLRTIRALRRSPGTNFTYSREAVPVSPLKMITSTRFVASEGFVLDSHTPSFST